METWASDGFVAAYEASYAALVRTATAIVGRRSVAEELVQDAFTATWRVRERVEDVAAYARRATVNGCRSYLRRHNVRREIGGRVPESPVSDTHRELTASIARLGFRKRAVLVLRYYDGLPDDEIAAALGMRRATVRSTVARALKELREVLGDDD